MSKVFTIFFVILINQLCGQTPGEVTDTVICKAARDQTYSLYIPSDYQQKKKLGLILLFEPMGRGKLPVSIYHELAEKYSLALACSNNSRNGSFESSQEAGRVVLEDLLQRYNVDSTFILASGFSGGGRMASFLAMSDSRIQGAIACGSTFPPSHKISPEKKVPYAEIIGDIDMNYLEAIDAFDYLFSIKNPVVLCLFAGGHGWPPAEIYEQAIQWHLYQRGRLSEKESDEYYKFREQQIEEQIDSLKLPVAYRNLLGLRADFSDGKKKPRTDSLLEKLTTDKELKKITKKFEKEYAWEKSMRERFATIFYKQVKNAAPDSAYNREAWEYFNRDVQSSVSSRNLIAHESGLRLHDFVWRFCVEQFYLYEVEQQYRQATLCAKIWTVMAPENPLPFYLAARAYGFQQNKSVALDYLGQAIDKGFHRPGLLNNEKAFSSFRSDPLFVQLTSKVKP
jgi:hypothetical protein